jgi:hypothetical protein
VSIILLDGVGAGFLVLLFGLGLLFIIIAIFLEAFVMQWMKYQSRYRNALVQSLVANLVSLAAGFVLLNVNGRFFHLENLLSLGVMFVVTFVVEFILLYLMNKGVPVKKTLAVSLAMNVVTYVIAIGITRGFNM